MLLSTRSEFSFYFSIFFRFNYSVYLFVCCILQEPMFVIHTVLRINYDETLNGCIHPFSAVDYF